MTFQSKPHYSTMWVDLCEFPEESFHPSSGQSTVITFQCVYSNGGYNLVWFDGSETIPYGGQVDFRMRAGIGNGYHSPTMADTWLFSGQLSAWSATETLTVPNNSTSTSATASHTPAPTVPEFPTWIILPLFAVLILLSTVFIRKRTPKK